MDGELYQQLKQVEEGNRNVQETLWNQIQKKRVEEKIKLQEHDVQQEIINEEMEEGLAGLRAMGESESIQKEREKLTREDYKLELELERRRTKSEEPDDDSK